jgi:hypothetical protein
MSDTPAGLAERMTSEGARTAAFFRALLPEQWAVTLYTDGDTWSVKDVLAHFVAAERGIARLVEVIVAGEAGTPQDFDLDAYNRKKVASLHDAPVEDLLEQFEKLRAASASLVAALQPEDLARLGRHPWLGIAPVEDIVKLMYRHNQIHQRDIRRALG